VTHVIDKDGNLLVSVDLDAIANPNGEGVSVDADGTVIAKLGDAAGAQKLSVTDSGDVEVASVDSDGNAQIDGGLNVGTATGAGVGWIWGKGASPIRHIVDTTGQYAVFNLYENGTERGAFYLNVAANAIIVESAPGHDLLFNTGGANTRLTIDHTTGLATFASGLNVGGANDRGPRLLVKSGCGLHGVWGYDGVDGTARTVISDGTDDVQYILSCRAVYRDSSGNAGRYLDAWLTPGNSVNLYDNGTDILTLAVAANGSVTVQRTGGSRTYKVMLDMIWL